MIPETEAALKSILLPGEYVDWLHSSGAKVFKVDLTEVFKSYDSKSVEARQKRNDELERDKR